MPDSIVIIQSGFLGDAVLASGMLRAIHAARPDLPVGIVVRDAFAGLFASHPAVKRLHAFAKKSKDGTARMIEQLREGGYTTALLPHRSFRSAWIARRAGISQRIGFRQSDAPWMLSTRVDYLIAEHETERNARLLASAGIESTGDMRLPWLLPEEEALQRMSGRFGADGPPVVIAPGSVWPTKRWTISGYAEVARRLAASGRRVILAGSADERAICEEIARSVSTERVEITAGELSLVELLALIALAEHVITNDSAPLHIAESVGTPVTAIFGPTVPEFGFGPRREHSSVLGISGLDCRPCRIHGSRRCPIGTHECMTRITADDLLNAAKWGGDRP
jgi:heptosyltransferase-2